MFALRTVAARSNQVCKPVVLNQLRAFAVGTPSSEDELTNLLKTDKDVCSMRFYMLCICYFYLHRHYVAFSIILTMVSFYSIFLHSRS